MANHREQGLRRASLSMVLACALCALTFVVLAAPGDLDTSFDGDGKVLTPIFSSDDRALAVALQPDGKLVAAGYVFNASTNDFGVARFNSNGSLDASFDTDGKVATDFLNNTDIANAVALQPDGKIILAGFARNGSNDDFALARYNTNGSLDTSFDGDGKVTTAFLNIESANAVAVQPDGKIVAVGSTLTDALVSPSEIAIARYNTDGSPDTSFDTDGKLTTSVLNGADIAYAVALQPDGKILVAGSASEGSPPSSDRAFMLVRYNPNGSLDTTFDVDGKLTFIFTGGDQANSLALQPDGKIVVAGRTSDTAPDFALARLNANGAFDTSFDGDGKLTTNFGASDVARAVVVQPNGKIVAVGQASGGASFDFALARYNSNGSLDASFDGDGKLTTSFTSGNDLASGVVLQPDGKIVAAGYAANGGDDFALARYDGDISPNEVSNFDTDRKSDIAVWNPANGDWHSINSSDGSQRIYYNWGDGSLGDRPVPGDYDGDGKTDLAIFRSSEGNWYVIRSSDGTVFIRNWGGGSDIPVSGDYDLDGKTDVAVFRPSEGNWYVLNSRDNTSVSRGWGASGDKPVPADYDGDGAADFAVFRPSDGNWYIITSRDRFVRVINWGLSDDKPVPADYDGDGRADAAVFRPAEGTWYIRLWTGAGSVRGWGNSTDVPVPADYDGDGRADIAVFRPSEGNWFIIESSTNTARLANLGPGTIPLPSAYLP